MRAETQNDFNREPIFQAEPSLAPHTYGATRRRREPDAERRSNTRTSESVQKKGGVLPLPRACSDNHDISRVARSELEWNCAQADTSAMGPDPHKREERLGQIMVDRGLLSEQQLAAALAEQRRERRPLGELLVALGFVSSAVVSDALAEQKGWTRGNDFGFSDRPRRHLHAVPTELPPSPEPDAAAAEPGPAPMQRARTNDLDAPRVLVEEQAAELAGPQHERPSADQARPHARLDSGRTQGRIAPRREPVAEARRSIGTQRPGSKRQPPVDDEQRHAQPELDTLRAQHRRDLEQIGALRQLLETSEVACARLRRQLDQVQRSRKDTGRRPAGNDTHKLFIATAVGYRLARTVGARP